MWGGLRISVAGQTCCATGRSMRKPRPSGVPRRPQLVRMTPPTQINWPVPLPGSCNFLMTPLMMLTMLMQRVSNVVAIGNPCGTSFFFCNSAAMIFFCCRPHRSAESVSGSGTTQRRGDPRRNGHLPGLSRSGQSALPSSRLASQCELQLQCSQ
jgi:hypothetical protein